MSPDPKAGATPNSAAAEAEFRAGEADWARGDVQGALRRYLAAVRMDPGNGNYHRATGFAFWHARDRAQGQKHLEEAIRLNPRDSLSHEILSELHLQAGNPGLALHHAEAAVRLVPRNPEHIVALATVLEADRRSNEAWDILQHVLKSGYRSMRLVSLFARLAPCFDKTDQAMELINHLLADGSLAKFQEASLRFQAAQLLDKAGDYEGAWAHASRANLLTGQRYNPMQVEAFVNESIAYFTPAKIQRLPRATHGMEKPIFIVGMPRSGTSLIEQILASYPAIHGAGELSGIFDTAAAAARRAAANRPGTQPVPVPRCLDRLSIEDLNELAMGYLQPLSALNPAARLISNKRPDNFLYLGFISVLFPEARIVHCQRQPLDTCVSCYMSNFYGYDFSTDLIATGHYYRQYERLMAHWKQVLSIPILDVVYEQVVDNLEAESRRLVDFLGLEWDPRCLNFHENQRFVATVSNEQVRKPIYKSSVERWRHYEKHLAPLRAALGWG